MKHVLATSILCVTVGLAAAGCGSSDASSGASVATSEQTPRAAGGGRMPGGSGKVTEVSGSTAQVQGVDAQVAVSWTGSTTFTSQVRADASAVAVGSCVMVMSDRQAGDTTSTTDVAAATVRVTKKTDGSCAIGGPGGAGRRANGKAPNGSPPTDRPSGAPEGGRGGFAVGEVTAVSGVAFTVSSTQPGTDDSTKVTVTTSDVTTYTTTKPGTAADIKVGVCVTSGGKADDTGAITATAIAVSQPVDGECGFGGFGAGSGAGQP